MVPQVAGMPSFLVSGTVVQVRELTTKVGNKVWAHVVKVAAVGGMFECQTDDEKLAKSVAQGQQVHATGHFEFFNNSIKLILTKIVLQEGA